MFEGYVRWSRAHPASLPLTFILAFYVTLIHKRRWEHYSKLPWPDKLAMLLRGLVRGEPEERALLIRRTVIRYCILSYVLCTRRLSYSLNKRFAEDELLKREDLVTEEELVLMGRDERRGRYDQKCIEIVDRPKQKI